MWKLIVSLCLIGAIAGCGSDVKNRMGTAAITTEEWPERDAIDEVIRGVGMAGERGSWRQAQQELDPTTFKTVLDALAASTAPGGYDDTKKAALVAAGDELIAAQKGSAEDFSKKYDALMAAIAALRVPPPE